MDVGFNSMLSISSAMLINLGPSGRYLRELVRHANGVSLDPWILGLARVRDRYMDLNVTWCHYYVLLPPVIVMFDANAFGLTR
jgi:hypothetical protein